MTKVKFQKSPCHPLTSLTNHEQPIPKTRETFPMLLGASLFLARLGQTAENPLWDTAETAR